MPDLDQRVTDGLRELVSRAPVNVDMWPNVERYVAKHRRRRRVFAGAVVAVALVGGGLVTAVVRGTGSKIDVSNPGATTDTTSPGSGGALLTADGPIEGSFTIHASPNGRLTFAPSALTVSTGIYAVTLADGSNAQHTLYFDDPATLWAPLMVNDVGETRTTRIFFGQPGTYTFYCALPGHRSAGMQGIVNATGPTITLAEAQAAGTTSDGSSPISPQPTGSETSTEVGRR